jgi:hypothetical protein
MDVFAISPASYAQSCGAKVIEAYPPMPGGLYQYMGRATLFEGRERRVFRLGSPQRA